MDTKILRMEPEQVRDMAVLVQDFAELVLLEANSISLASGGLAGNLNNPGILDNLYGAVSRLNELAQEMIELGILLTEEAEEWETADLKGASNFNGLGYIPSIYVVPAPTPPDIESPSLPPPPPPPVIPPIPPPTPHIPPSPPPSGNPAPPMGNPIPPGEPSLSPTGTTAGTGVAVGGTATNSYFDSPYWKERAEELERLNEEIANLEGQENLSPEERVQLEEMREQRDKLQQAFDEGIFSQGLSPDENPFEKGQCTWYATSRRNLYPHVFGHAKFWASQATKAGLEVGEMPVKGSIMVWQPDVKGADAAYGHVSFVENVEQLSDGTYKVYYTDNKYMDPTSPRSIILRLGEAGIDFIYG